jgi:SAM-dependent methyltransferase
MSLLLTIRQLLNAKTWAALRVAMQMKPFYRACYIVGMAEGGLLQLLSRQVLPFDELFARICRPGNARQRDALDAWMRLGVTLAVVGVSRRGYFIRSRIARRIARPENDAALALLQSMVHVHHEFVTEGLSKLRSGSWLAPGDLAAELIARSSLTVESVLAHVIGGLVPSEGAFRLLEVGCGTGAYIRHAARRNRSLTALGLDLHPGVTAIAHGNMRDWGLSDRVSIETGDIRDYDPVPIYDLVTLHNNIYYFDQESRAALLHRLRGFLKPSGQIAVTTWHDNGGLGTQAINLWFSLLDGCGRLPKKAEMLGYLSEAGFADITYQRLLPLEAYGMFTAKKQ